MSEGGRERPSWRDEPTRPTIQRMMDKNLDEECHWSPWCDNEGTHYVTVMRPPTEVWACRECRPPENYDTEKE